MQASCIRATEGVERASVVSSASSSSSSSLSSVGALAAKSSPSSAAVFVVGQKITAKVGTVSCVARRSPATQAKITHTCFALQWKKFYPGTVARVNADSSYDLVFDDGDKRRQVPAASMRPVGQSPPPSSSQSESAGDESQCQSAASSLADPGAGGKFRAPDGASFATKKEYRKYMVDNFFSFKDKSGETLMKKPGEINGQSFDIRDVKDCTLMVLDHSAQILMVSGASFALVPE